VAVDEVGDAQALQERDEQSQGTKRTGFLGDGNVAKSQGHGILPEGSGRSEVTKEARAEVHKNSKRLVKGGDGKKNKRLLSGGQKQRTIQVLVACSWRASDHPNQGCEI
jgi:hypothetical protein